MDMMSIRVSKMSKLKDPLRYHLMIKERCLTNRPCSKKPVDIWRRKSKPNEMCRSGDAFTNGVKILTQQWISVCHA